MPTLRCWLILIANIAVGVSFTIGFAVDYKDKGSLLTQHLYYLLAHQLVWLVGNLSLLLACRRQHIENDFTASFSNFIILVLFVWQATTFFYAFRHVLWEAGG